MSTAFYKPSAIPTLLRAFPRWKRPAAPAGPSAARAEDVEGDGPFIEVWNTTCVVTNFGRGRPGGPRCSVLVNPSNPQLSGASKFPYFPRGGPAPEEYPKVEAHHIMGYVTSWGGMEVGTGMLFASNVVDGLVHRLGGWRLALEIRMLPFLEGDERCPVGRAVLTSPGGADLRGEYDAVVHTTPPFFRHHDNPEGALARCYGESLRLAFDAASWDRSGDGNARVAAPILGAGCRGFPLDVAVRVAAEESIRWRDDAGAGGRALAFGVPDQSAAEALVDAIEREEELARNF